MMLNMSSATTGPHARPDPAPTGPDASAEADLTARARIRDAAIARFAADGVAATSVRAIAGDAGVSAALVIHHFGSKDALRVACDQHIAALIRERKRAAMQAGPGLDPLAALRESGQGPEVLRYLASTLIDGSPHVAELLDELIDDAVGYMEEGVATGMLRPTEDPRGRAVVLTIWSLGALALHQHLQRLLGVDLTGDPADALAYFLPASEMLGRGVITEETYERMRAGLQPAQEDGP
jgi:AcrR family transcriptional regulator